MKEEDPEIKYKCAKSYSSAGQNFRAYSELCGACGTETT
jgi:hypothetical protein